MIIDICNRKKTLEERERLRNLYYKISQLAKLRDDGGIKSPLKRNRCPYCGSKLYVEQFTNKQFEFASESVLYIYKRCSACLYEWGSINGW